MKKIKRVLTAIVVMLGVVGSIIPQAAYAEEIYTAKASVRPTYPSNGETVMIMAVNDVQYVYGWAYPKDPTGQGFIWSNSDPSVIEIRKDNVVVDVGVERVQATAMKPGKAVISITSVSNPEVTASLEIYVRNPDGTIDRESELPFADVSVNDWFYEVVRKIYQTTNGNGSKYMSGYEGGTKFGPTDPVSRGQFATIMWRMENEPDAEYDGQFPDVDSNMFFAKASAWAGNGGIIKGYENGLFGGTDSVTREQVATILHRYAQSRGYGTFAWRALDDYADAATVSAYAKASLEWAYGAGIITGTADGRLNPQGTASRAECAAMILRFKRFAGC